MNIGKSKKTLLQFLESIAVFVLVGSGVSPAAAALVNEVEPNNSVGTTQNIDSNFTLDFDENIGDTKSNTSTIIPHVTIKGTGDNTFDHYSFMVTKAGDKGIFDIDSGSTDGVELDAYLQLFDSSGALLAIDDDSPRGFGQGGADPPWIPISSLHLTPPASMSFKSEVAAQGRLMQGVTTNSKSHLKIR